MGKAGPMLAAAVAVAALGAAGCGRDTPPATEVVYLVAVDTHGRPAEGYREQPSDDSATSVFGCGASPAAVVSGIYECSPSAAGADACWPASANSLLCLDNPWDKQLHRVTISGALPQVGPTADPQPVALLLDDGTRCRRRQGGAWGGRDDDYLGAYGCESSDLTVLAKPDQAVVDRSTALWTVQVGELGPENPHFPPPQTRTVRTAWFAGHPD